MTKLTQMKKSDINLMYQLALSQVRIQTFIMKRLRELNNESPSRDIQIQMTITEVKVNELTTMIKEYERQLSNFPAHAD